MKKVFIIAYRGSLIGIFTNKTIVWGVILKLFKTTVEELKSRKRTISGEYIWSRTDDWRHAYKTNVQNNIRKVKTLASVGSLTSVFTKTNNLRIFDLDEPEEFITIQERFLNEEDIPDENPDYEY